MGKGNANPLKIGPILVHTSGRECNLTHHGDTHTFNTATPSGDKISYTFAVLKLNNVTIYVTKTKISTH